MRVHFRRFLASGFIGTFMAGLLALLPIILTIVIVTWLAGQIRVMLGPGSFFGDLLSSAGSTLFGMSEGQLGFWLGLAIALLAIWSLGLVVTLQARKSLTGAIDGLFNRVPLLGTIYRPVAQVVRLLGNQEDGELKGMTVVTARLGNDTTMDVLALQASPDVFRIEDEDRLMIYVPTAPVPMGGFLILVAAKDVAPVPGMEVDDLMKVYFSIGTLAGEAMPDQTYPD